jgi:hypothetical protein
MAGIFFKKGGQGGGVFGTECGYNVGGQGDGNVGSRGKQRFVLGTLAICQMADAHGKDGQRI